MTNETAGNYHIICDMIVCCTVNCVADVSTSIVVPGALARGQSIQVTNVQVLPVHSFVGNCELSKFDPLFMDNQIPEKLLYSELLASCC